MIFIVSVPYEACFGETEWVENQFKPKLQLARCENLQIVDEMSTKIGIQVYLLFIHLCDASQRTMLCKILEESLLCAGLG